MPHGVPKIMVSKMQSRTAKEIIVEAFVRFEKFCFWIFLERQKSDISIFMSKGFNLTKLEKLCRINHLLFWIKTCMVFLPAYYSEMYIDVNSPICCKRKNGLFGKAPKTKSI